MDPALVQKALDALQAGDAEAALELLKQLIASAAGGEPPPDQSPPPDAPSPEDQALMAASRTFLATLGASDVTTAVAELQRLVAIKADVEKREAQIAKDKQALDMAERQKLVAELVKCGAEIPATAWKDDAGSVPCDRLANEPLELLRSRVSILTHAKQRGSNPRPPVAITAGDKTLETRYGPVTLSVREQAICKESNCKLEDYAENKAIQENAKRRGAGMGV